MRKTGDLLLRKIDELLLQFTTIECVVSEEDVSIEILLKGIENIGSFDLIRDLISKNKIENALEKLLIYAHQNNDTDMINQIIILQSKFRRIEEEMIKGITEHNEYSKSCNQINNSILTIIDGI